MLKMETRGTGQCTRARQATFIKLSCVSRAALSPAFGVSRRKSADIYAEQKQERYFWKSKMRDNHKGMPEIIDAFIDEKEQYTGVVAIEINDEVKKFRFGVSPAGYHALKRVLQIRAFEVMPGLKHRYFYAGSVRKLEFPKCEATFRVEQGRNGKELFVEAPLPLIQNLTWFKGLKDFGEAAHLSEVK